MPSAISLRIAYDAARAAMSFTGTTYSVGVNACAHDAVGTEHALVDVGDVHGAALALAHSRRTAEQLGHHARHLHALGDAVAVTAMGGADHVAVPQMRADARRHRLLAGVEMQEARQSSGRHQLRELLLEEPDHPHAPVGVAELIPRQIHGPSPLHPHCIRVPETASERPGHPSGRPDK
jgi:hypothetical protein